MNYSTTEPILIAEGVAIISASDRLDTPRPKVCNDGFGVQLADWADLARITATMHYSQSLYRDGRRAKSNAAGLGSAWIFDVDDGPDLKQAWQMLQGRRALLVTTRSHTPHRHKYRILLAGDAIITGGVPTHYAAMQEVLARRLGIHDFIDRKCLGDPARQYAPNGRQEAFYIEGDPIDTLELFAASRPAQAPRTAIPRAVSRETYTGESVIARFNELYTVEEVLERYGYIRKGKRWLSPFSESGDPGVTILEGADGKRRAYSHHASDPWTFGDAFDIFVNIEFDGDVRRAIDYLKEEK